ncbi:MAG: hypothetical protein CL910_08930 [Deltaproteobacteria bacterium]|jgi:hypothetical protein|nr:hypothetical protein [Deltaproteobacteria bacterium]
MVPMMPRVLAVAILSVSLAVGCTARMGDLVIVSSHSVNVSPEPLRAGAEGQDCAYRFLPILLGGLPIGKWVPNIEDAMDRAIETTPDGNLLTNVVMYQTVWSVILMNGTCLKVRGDVGVER